MSDAAEEGIFVLAGPNGSGKTSILGKMIVAKDAPHIDCDQAARRLMEADPSLTFEVAVYDAWTQMKVAVKQAVDERLTTSFETTLGGDEIPALLDEACQKGIPVRIWYVGLDSAELAMDRVRRRVAKGGHDIDEDTIRANYNNGQIHLIDLLPSLATLYVYDNSEDADPDAGQRREPKLILHMEGGEIIHCDLEQVPGWARAIVRPALPPS